MTDIAIRVEGLSKQYLIGTNTEKYRTLRDSLTRAAKAPVRLARTLVGHNGHRPPKRTPMWALRDVTFDIHQGEVVGIIGRNGAGKSTLLKILSRITEPTEGYAEVHGRVGSLLEVGTGFHPELTGRENILLNGAILGMKRADIQAKFDEIVAFSEVEKFIDTPVKHYSSGMYLRLAFAVAAHLDPEILLVDEVLAVGDQVFQQKCIRKMGAVATEGRTVLFVSHNMAAIQNLCNSVMLMHNGALLASGQPEQVIGRYTMMRTSTAEAPVRKSQPGALATVNQLVVTDAHGSRRSTFTSGESITARVHVSAGRRLDRVVIGLTLTTAWGTRVCNVRSEDAGFEVTLHPGPNCIAVTFQLKGFLENMFFVNVGLQHQSAEILDRYPNAAELNIIAHDISGFGKTRNNGEIVYVASDWAYANGKPDSPGTNEETRVPG
jgi:lipopolysaccharide transport system ATP-binding protein